MRARRLALAAGVAALTVAPVGMASGQMPSSPQPALVTYRLPGPEPLTMSDPAITAFVSLPPVLLPDQKVYVTITGPAPVEKTLAASPGCQEVALPPLTKNGRYRISVTTELPGPEAGGSCQGGSDLPREVEVAVPAKPAAASPAAGAAAPRGPGGAGPSRARAGGPAGGASIAGIDVARFEADFDKLKGNGGRASGPGPEGEGGFQQELGYGEPGERDEELGTSEESGAGRATLPFVAGALLALDGFLLLRFIRSQVLREPLAG